MLELDCLTRKDMYLLFSELEHCLRYVVIIVWDTWGCEHLSTNNMSCQIWVATFLVSVYRFLSTQTSKPGWKYCHLSLTIKKRRSCSYTITV